MTVQAIVSFRIPVQQEFPAEFIARSERQFPEPRLFLNARHLYPAPDPVSIPPGYREVSSAAHPLRFAPYQYEGFTPAERRLLRTADIRMRVFVGR
jgi:hypothetical protein